MHNRWHPDLEPTVRVAPGQELRLQCEDGAAGQLTRASTHDDVARMDLGLPHPLTGPVFVEGAQPGDLLEIEFLRYETPDFGFTPILPGLSFLDDVFPDPYLVKWELANGFARSDELPGVAVPGDPFAGVAGVAPSHELLARFREREERIRAAGGPVADDAPESARPPTAAGGLRTIPPRETGGNVDIRGLVAGSTLRLPVHVEGALFSIGDLHFAQGDGEVCGWAIEIAGAVTVRFSVRKGEGNRLRFPSYTTPARPERRAFATTGLPVDDAMDLTVAARAALLEMIEWLQETRGFTREAAYALCSVCVDLRLSQVVDVPYPLVSALLPLDVFEGARSPQTVVLPAVQEVEARIATGDIRAALKALDAGLRYAKQTRNLEGLRELRARAEALRQTVDEKHRARLAELTEAIEQNIRFLERVRAFEGAR